MSVKPYRVGLIGFGNIGTGLVRHLMEQADLLSQRLPGGIELVAISDREFDRPRGVTPAESTKLTTNWREITGDASIDGVVELVGVGADGKPSLALEIARATLSSGKDFITANKGLIAVAGGELEELARANNAMLLYEASVGAGIPLISTLQTALAPNAIKRIDGIVNGTCNYILTKLTENPALTLKETISEAQKLGYAEPDPKFDVEGDDSAYKAAILASLSFGQEVPVSAIRTEGITRLSQTEIRYAAERGMALKLLISAQVDEQGGVDVCVGPAFLPAEHPMANVRGVYNGVLVSADPIGPTMYFGRGAGQGSTGSGIVSDIMIAARRRQNKAPNPFPLSIRKGVYSAASPDAIQNEWYLRFDHAAGKRRELTELFKAVSVTEKDGALLIETPALSRPALDNLLEETAQLGFAKGNLTLVRFV